MTTHAMRAAGIVLLACLIEACTGVGHIQRNEPVRTMKFTGDYKVVAQCVHGRLGGRIQTEAASFVVYDAVKARQAEGITHYAVTVGPAPGKSGFAELRIMRPVSHPGPPSSQPPATRASAALIDEYWKPVRDCAAQVKPAA
jgi:hypothetical protein